MIVVAATALNALWQDALLVTCIWLFLRAWPKVNAATRYVVWSATLLAAIVVPIATTFAFFAPVQPAVAISAHHTTSASRAAAEALRRGHYARETRATGARGVAPALPARLQITLPLSVAIGVFAVWALLAAYALIGLLLGLRRLEELKRDALPLPLEYRDAMPQWNDANKGHRPVRLCVSDAIDVPVAVGLFDSMILIPRELLDRLSPAEVEQISLHELAHLRRGDDWSNCAARVIVAALGWNPAALFIAQQLELEREVACDDWVLASIGTVRPYALCLTKMAETAAWPHHPMPAPGVFTTRKQISLRIERLLGTGRDVATTLAIGPAAAAVAAVGALAIVIALVAPSVAAPPPAVAATSKAVITAPKAVLAAPKGVVTTPKVVVTAPKVVITAPKVLVKNVRVAVPVAPLLRQAQGDRSLAQGDRSLAQGDDMVAQASGKACVGCDLEGVNWAGRDLRGSDYTGVDFRGANLSGVNLSDSRLLGADFTNANLSAASFHHAHLAGCDFTRADLNGANLSNTSMSGCKLAGADLRNVNFTGAALVSSDFTNARLDGANFAGATLEGCDFDGVDLSHVDLSRAKTTGMDFSKRRSPP